jgi:glycosyltransferase involved in cell wall biosynthesis
MFNVPERISLALVSRGATVLYCEAPVSRVHRKGQPLTEVSEGVYRFGPEYLGAKFNSLPVIGHLQWKAVARQIVQRAESLQLKDPVFIYSHFENMAPLCEEMRAAGYPLVHICMDYPEPYQYELIEASDQTLVIPKHVFRDLQARYGEKIQWIPQSIHLPAAKAPSHGSHREPVEITNIPPPRLGYLGSVFARLNLPLLREVLTRNPHWFFVYFGDPDDSLPSNARAMGWHRPEELPRYVESLDAGLMPYDCSGKKNLYCSPLKLYDYFLKGLPVVSTPILEISEFKDLVYVGATAEELAAAVARALEEPPDSPKRALRRDVARTHSTEVQGQRLEEVLELLKTGQRKSA